MSKYKIYWAGYHPEKSVQAQSILLMKNELENIYGSELDFKFVSDIGDLKYNALDLLSLVENGDIDCCYFYSSYLTDRAEELNLFEIPFQISSRKHIYKILDSEIGQYLAEKIEKNSGYKVLGWWDNGIRHVSSNKIHIKSFEDCKKSTIRIAKNEMHKLVFENLGFRTKFVDVKQLQSAIINYEVDTQENPLTNIINYGIEDYHPYITTTSHLFGTSILLSNKKKYDAWPDIFKLNLSNVIKKATHFQRKLAFDEDIRCLEYLKKKGTKIQEMDKELRDRMKKISLETSLRELEKIPRDIQEKFFSAE